MTRFEETWRIPYSSSSSLEDLSWYIVSGNHDHRGNVTAQIAYSFIQPRWKYPSLYYHEQFYSADESISVDIIFIDTVLYTGVYSGNAYPAEPADMTQHEWLENTLASSTADYIIVAGHYPVYSGPLSTTFHA